MTPRPPRSTLFPYTTLFRSNLACTTLGLPAVTSDLAALDRRAVILLARHAPGYQEIIASEMPHFVRERSEEHTSELQSQFHLVCRLLLEKKKPHTYPNFILH